MDSSQFPTYKKGQLVIHCQSDHKLPKGFRRHSTSRKSVRMSKDLERVKLIPAREKPRKKRTSRSPPRQKKPNLSVKSSSNPPSDQKKE